jgi:hypothetical protein
MTDGKNGQRQVTNPKNDDVGKAAQAATPHVVAWNLPVFKNGVTPRVCCDQLKCVLNGIKKLIAKPGADLLVAGCCFNEFQLSERVDREIHDAARPALRRFRCSRASRKALSAGTGLTTPCSISAIRRSTSFAQAWASCSLTKGPWKASGLFVYAWSIWSAKNARSAAGNAKTLANSSSRSRLPDSSSRMFMLHSTLSP